MEFQKCQICLQVIPETIAEIVTDTIGKIIPETIHDTILDIVSCS